MTAEKSTKNFPVFFHLLHAVEKIFSLFSIHAEKAVYASRDFPWTKQLESEAQNICSELRNILARREPIPNFQEVSPEQSAITAGDTWKTFIFYAYGVQAARNCVECPQTTAALKKIPGLKTAFFSILAGESLIPEHRGPYKGLLRCHLGLLIPPQCGIRIGGNTYEWEQGKTLVFDDTYVHSAWNHSNQDRVVLFIDFVRPMRFPLSMINQMILWAIVRSPYGKKYIVRFKKWYQEHGIKSDV